MKTESNTDVKNKESLFSSVPAALRISSYEVGKCARKVNPLLDQSEHFIKKDFSSPPSRTCEVYAHGQ